MSLSVCVGEDSCLPPQQLLTDAELLLHVLYVLRVSRGYHSRSDSPGLLSQAPKRPQPFAPNPSPPKKNQAELEFTYSLVLLP